MNNRDSILKRAGKPDDRLILSKALDKAGFTEKTGKTAYTDFLDPRQQGVLEQAFDGFDEIGYSFFGGFHGAERALAIFRPDFIDDDEESEYGDFLKVLHIVPAGRDSLSHRDYLGALLALGIKREKTGDFLVREESCDVFVLQEIAEFIRMNLTKVGNTKVSVEIGDISGIRVPEQKVREISITVASLRLDCIAAPGFGMSRSKAAEFIKAGKLSLNWEVTDNPSKPVKAGDALTIRGRGRVIVDSIGGRSKKDRVGVLLHKFV